jgi:pimeloyl-ACP methyl ester carboxylesterase
MVIASILILIVCIHLLRKQLLSKETSSKNHEDFSGDLYQVAHSIVAHKKNTGQSQRTIICMHGWLENYRYFTQLYTPNDGEIIFVNSSDYHATNKNITPIKADWQTAPRYELHTIEHDAEILIQAVKNLASTDELWLHGHSRGGAVVLEAIKQNQALFKNATVILEAPILPEAPIVKANNRPKVLNDLVASITMYPLPFIATWIRKFGIPNFVLTNISPMNERKKLLLSGLLDNYKYTKVLIDNLENMNAWALANKIELLNLINKGYLLIGSKDEVLSRSLMLKLARKSKDNITVIESKNSSHFLTLDIPEQIKSLKFE